jgi:selenophosphate synthase
MVTCKLYRGAVVTNNANSSAERGAVVTNNANSSAELHQIYSMIHSQVRKLSISVMLNSLYDFALL